ncbi:MAG: hybrid sensor histidine kinase/response regulator, partial [Ferrimonas sp.]
MGALEIGVIALIYVALLFLLGRWAERYRRLTLARWLPLMYGLSFAVYCSSWSFLGAEGQASQQPWSFLPIFLAPILLFSFGFGLLRRVVQAAKQQNITSVADFIASRYGKSQGLAAVVTLIAMLGLMPYMALQLNAMVLAFTALAPAPLVTLDHTGPITQMLNSERSLALLLALILALLAMLFGTRKLDSSEHNPGMTVAVAFDAIMKLAIFLVVGGVVLAYAGGPSALWMQLQAQPEQPSYQLDLLDIAPATCLAMAAFLALPRMFHVLVVENQQVEDLCRNRWTFPVYLLLFMSMVVPLSVAGLVFLPANISVDIMVIALPQQLELKGLTALAMLGALSAATSMVVVGAVAMAIMISNEWVIPLLLRSHRIKSNNFAQLQQRLLNLRRVIILLMLLGAYGAYWLFGSSVSLSHIGLFAFGAFAQLAPAIVGAVYWRRGHRYGVFAGLLIGLLGWLFVAAPHITLLEHSWHWFGYETDASRLLLVLLANMLGYVLVSLLAIPSVTDRVQANVFTQGN